MIPVYNTEGRISDCIESVLKQTESNLEIFLVNDGSTDRSGEICDQYATRDPRVHVIHQENRGAGEARNRGLRESTGEYLYFLDSDDRIKETLLEDNCDLADESGSDIVIFGYTKTEISASGKKQVYTPKLTSDHFKTVEGITRNLADLLDAGATFAAWNKLFRAEMIKMNRVTFPSFQRNQDMVFTLEALKQATSITVNREVYYIHEYSLEEFKYDEQLIENHLYVFDLFYHLYPGWMSIRKNREYALKLFVLTFFHSVPFYIAKQASEPLSKLRDLFHHKQFRTYMDLLKEFEAGNLAIQSGFLILKMRSPVILYVVTQIKETLSGIIGKHRFRSLFNQ